MVQLLCIIIWQLLKWLNIELPYDPVIPLLGVCMYVYVYIHTCMYISPRLMTTCGGGGLVTKSCLTLVTPWTLARQAPLSIGFSRQEYWSGLPLPSPGDLPDPGIKPRCPTLQADSLLTELWGKPLYKSYEGSPSTKSSIKWEVLFVSARKSFLRPSFLK